MTHTIFIVTYRKDFEYLKYCLRSIDKFATGFDVVVAVPDQDFSEAVELARQTPKCPIAVRHGQEWPEKGFLWHEYVIHCADLWCPQSDLIFHMDADCLFTEPVTPFDFMRDERPILFYESFASLGPKHPEILRWRDCTRNCLPWEPEAETMRRHPEVYWKNLYQRARTAMAEKTGEDLRAYLQRQKNDYPQSHCEFVTLGNVALHEVPDQYFLYDLEKLPWPTNKLYQGWSHHGMRTEDWTVIEKAGLA